MENATSLDVLARNLHGEEFPSRGSIIDNTRCPCCATEFACVACEALDAYYAAETAEILTIDPMCVDCPYFDVCPRHARVIAHCEAELARDTTQSLDDAMRYWNERQNMGLDA